jgi:hypothetical protein
MKKGFKDVYRAFSFSNITTGLHQAFYNSNIITGFN